MSLAVLLFVASGAGAETGTHPTIVENLSCDVVCIDTYVAKCTQAVRWIEARLTDSGSEGCVDPPYGVMTVTTPTSLLGQSAALNVLVDCTNYNFIVRPYSGAEGTMQAIITVVVPQVNAGPPRNYTLEIGSFSDKYGYRSASLTKKQHQ